GSPLVIIDKSGNLFARSKIAIGELDINKIGDYSLSVKGNARFNKAVVKPDTWPDYVFEKNYILPDLKETEKFIRQNKHLPEIPSAAEVEKNGIDLGDNQSLLLQKIEELTLYVIDLNKKYEILKAQNEKLMIISK
ncbi:MAG TPA: hypothetical protein VK498_00350, partial [Ferruginibacter sp.]|nr:hypothetical protein [Ferruginibacter sp.]